MEKLTIVSSGGVLFIGMKKKDMEHDSSFTGTFIINGITLLNPRMILANPEERQLSLAKCIGNPSVIDIIGTINFQYPNEDPDLAQFYEYEINGYPDEKEAEKEPSKIIQFPQ